MQSAFPIVVFGAVALSVVMSVVFLLGHGSVYDQIGEEGLSRDSDRGGGPMEPAFDSPVGRAEQEREIRQMLSARSNRLVEKGLPALDIDAEVAQLMQTAEGPGAHDGGIAEEVRQLVVARNERRARQGQEPLEVEAEVARTLAELNP
jgi:hypothetical protein